MLLRTEEAGPKISDSDVASLEKKLGTRLPTAYREFLLAHNGGRPIPAGFPLMLLGRSLPWRVHFFYAIRDSEESTDIDYNLELTRHTRPRGVIPIASDEGGRKIYLGIGPENYNQVFFGGFPEPGGIVQLTPIAARFEEFLSGLEDSEALSAALETLRDQVERKEFH